MWQENGNQETQSKHKMQSEPVDPTTTIVTLTGNEDCQLKGMECQRNFKKHKLFAV